jgi:hypothetical protein
MVTNHFKCDYDIMDGDSKCKNESLIWQNSSTDLLNCQSIVSNSFPKIHIFK